VYILVYYIVKSHLVCNVNVERQTRQESDYVVQNVFDAVTEQEKNKKFQNYMWATLYIKCRERTRVLYVKM